MDLWYDWFCRDSSLERKGKDLLKKLKMIAPSKKFDNDKCYVFFKNNCPLYGSLFDDFRICDKETGDVLYCVVPKSGYKRDNGRAQLYGVDNDFKEPLIEGTWRDIKKWFLAD
ncbi:MAG: hypothetical protein IJ341_12850 [Bacteroidales bacterium]|nr:hypothetical protein [Bacteroidales bacterium]